MNLVNEVFAFTTATLLSCGASQVFGLAKGTVDVIRFSRIVKKNLTLSESRKLATNHWDCFQKTKFFVVIQNKLNKEEVSQEEVLQYLVAKKIQTKEKMHRCSISILADTAALIPFIGAHISWRIATGYTQISYAQFFARSTTHLVENYQKYLRRLLFVGNSEMYEKSSTFKEDFRVSIDLKNEVNNKSQNDYSNYIQTYIPVCTSTRRRSISATYCSGKKFKENSWVDVDITAPTVVLFHGNHANEVSLFGQASLYQQKGYNTLCVTIGGYGNSSGVRTSEGTVYQDVEAIKHYLSQQGVTQVAYHGMSMGGAVALHAAAAESSVNLKTLFVTVDKTFTSARDVGGNFVKNFPKVPSFLEFAGQGVLAAAVKPGLSVELPGGKRIKTDGFDNLSKVKILKEKGIPLICVKGESDRMMGFGKEEDEIFQRNHADLLFEAYYGKYPSEEEKECLIAQNLGHEFPLINVNIESRSI